MCCSKFVKSGHIFDVNIILRNMKDFSLTFVIVSDYMKKRETSQSQTSAFGICLMSSISCQ